MAKLVTRPSVITAAGNKPKTILEFVGRVNTGTGDVSIARMHSPQGWTEPGQTPAFGEYTLVLRGSLRVTTRDGVIDVRENEAILTAPGEWVQYSTPSAEGADYISVCVPAFSPDTVHRDH